MVVEDIHNLLGTPEDEIIRISAKTGVNVEQVLATIVEQVPPPKARTKRRWKP